MRTLIQQGGRKGRLLKTGQTTSYGSGDGVDDGATQKGLAKSYTVLSSGQYAGTTAITINSKTDTHSNNCVLDNNTGLMWSRYVSASVGPASDGLLPWTTTGADETAEGIFPYAAAANAASLAGYTDWRIPNIYELSSIHDYQAATAIPDSSAFPSFPLSAVYTSTTRPDSTTRALCIDGTNGLSSGSLKTDTKLALLVRGG